MKEFVTAVAEVVNGEEEDKGSIFFVDGRELTYYRPGDGQLAYLMAATSGRSSTNADKVAGLLNFFDAILDDDSSQYIGERLLSRTDKFGIDEVQEIMEWMVEQWAGRPTKRLSDSSKSQTTDGPKSTPAIPVSTSSDSDRIAF